MGRNILITTLLAVSFALGWSLRGHFGLEQGVKETTPGQPLGDLLPERIPASLSERQRDRSGRVIRTPDDRPVQRAVPEVVGVHAQSGMIYPPAPPSSQTHVTAGPPERPDDQELPRPLPSPPPRDEEATARRIEVILKQIERTQAASRDPRPVARDGDGRSLQDEDGRPIRPDP
jgi:hypothetical protein